MTADGPHVRVVLAVPVAPGVGAERVAAAIPVDDWVRVEGEVWDDACADNLRFVYGAKVLEVSVGGGSGTGYPNGTMHVRVRFARRDGYLGRRFLLVVVLLAALVALLGSCMVGNWLAAGSNVTLVLVVVGSLVREATRCP